MEGKGYAACGEVGEKTVRTLAIVVEHGCKRMNEVGMWIEKNEFYLKNEVISASQSLSSTK